MTEISDASSCRKRHNPHTALFGVVREGFPSPCAAIALAVERTLDKGKGVGSNPTGGFAVMANHGCVSPKCGLGAYSVGMVGCLYSSRF